MLVKETVAQATATSFKRSDSVRKWVFAAASFIAVSSILVFWIITRVDKPDQVLKQFKRCAHDELQSRFNRTLPVIINYDRHVVDDSSNRLSRRTTDNWASIRIKMDTTQIELDLANESDLLQLLTTAIIPTVKDYFETVLTVRPAQSAIGFNPCSVWYAADYTKCQALRTSTNRATGTTVPNWSEYVLSGFKFCPIRSTQCTSIAAGGGKSGFDTLIFVSAQQTSSCGIGTLAYAIADQQDQYDRPAIGWINFCPQTYLQTSSAEASTDPMVASMMIATTIHEVSHILAINSNLYAYYRDVNNVPRTPRNSYGDPSNNPDPMWGTYAASTSVVQSYSERNKANVWKVVTPTVAQKAQEQFGCLSLQGAELEQDGQGYYGSHPEKRVFLNDFMTAIYDQTAAPVISDVSLAFFQDSGWYQVDFRFTQPLTWGKNKGCAFAMDKCINSLTASPSDNTAFCTNQGLAACALGRTTKAKCQMASWTSIPLEEQYFTNKNIGGTMPFADYCPYYQTYGGSDCRMSSAVSASQASNFGENSGPASRCFMSALSASTGAPRCHAVDCSPDGSSYTVKVGSRTVNCGAGGFLTSVMGYSGTLSCAPVAEICPQPTCASGCSGRGRCVSASSGGSGCICFPGFGGSDCSLITYTLDDSRAVAGLAPINRTKYATSEQIRGSSSSPSHWTHFSVMICMIIGYVVAASLVQ